MNLDDLVFAGHSAVFLRSGEYTVAIDPWLAGNPLCPEEVKQPDQIDIIIATHGHDDHASEIPHLATRYNARVIANFELGGLLQKAGVAADAIIPMNKGGSVAIDGLTITLTQAFHSSSFTVEDGTAAYAGEPCGVVVQADNVTVYHAGDTIAFSDMNLIRELYKPSVSLLPIGDAFTMGPIEAALAAKYIGADVNIPIHYGTFPLLTGTPEEFSTACRSHGMQATVVEPGETFALGAI